MKALHRLEKIQKLLNRLKEKSKRKALVFFVLFLIFTGGAGFFIIQAKQNGFLKSFKKNLFKNKHSTVALQINEQKWSAKAFAKRLAFKIQALNIQDVKNQKLMEKLKKQLITDMTVEYLLLKQAKEHFLVVSEKELKKALEKGRHLNEKAFLMFLKRKNLNLREWKERIKKNLLIKKATQQISAGALPPSSMELKEYYKTYAHLFKKPARLLIYHIFHKKKEILIKIKSAKEKTLSQAVRDFMASPLKAEWVEKGVLKVFDQAFLLKKKEISPIWQSPYGWHLIQVIDKKPAVRISFEEAQEEIRAELMERRKKALFTKWIDQQSKNLNILKNEAVLKKIKVDMR